jgi:hypothetical protein
MQSDILERLDRIEQMLIVLIDSMGYNDSSDNSEVDLDGIMHDFDDDQAYDEVGL